MLTAEQHGSMALYILQHNFHKPFVDGKANRAKIEEQITVGLYSKQIPPLTESDVDIVCECINMAIDKYGVK